VVKGVVAVVV
jgi:hypothetical protein